MFVEVMFTALLVYVVLSSTNARFPLGFAGVAAGLTYALINLVTIPVDNTSVNPARSFGTALFAGTNALSQLWLFIVFPLVGGAVGALIWLMIDEARLEDTMFADVPGATELRDAADKIDDKLDETFVSDLSPGKSDTSVLQDSAVAWRVVGAVRGFGIRWAGLGGARPRGGA